jgi:hypothetical protein
MTTEQLQQFGDLVSKVKTNENGFTDHITTYWDGVTVRTGDTNSLSGVWLKINLPGTDVSAFLNPSEAMAVAASLVAQVLRIANAKDAEQ